MPVQQTASEKLNDIYCKNKKEAYRDFFKFLSFKSISSENEYAKDVRECAEWLKSYIGNMSFETELWETPGHPILFAERKDAGPEKPTLLIYNHYDVQPVDPIEEWFSPPFSPEERNGTIYARGAQDNKGQCFYVVQAIKTLLEKDGKLPVNIKWVIEGEEECGSQSLAGILREKKDKLKADYLAIIDLAMKNAATPAIILGIRGILAIDVEIIGSNTDLHSGMQGGIVFNPLHAMVELLAKLRDKDGRIQVPGFYDKVRLISQEELSRLSMDFDEKTYKETFAAEPVGGEKGYSPLERAWLRPSLEINGIGGGYFGEGFKTVIPAKAVAKVSCRLVPDMDPTEIGASIVAFLENNAPKGCQVKVKIRPGSGAASRANPDSKIVKAFSKAYEETFHTPTAFLLDGGSIPIATELAKASASEVVFLGLGLSTDMIHAPNEHFGVDRFDKGVLATARAIELLGGM